MSGRLVKLVEETLAEGKVSDEEMYFLAVLKHRKSENTGIFIPSSIEKSLTEKGYVILDKNNIVRITPIGEKEVSKIADLKHLFDKKFLTGIKNKWKAVKWGLQF